MNTGDSRSSSSTEALKPKHVRGLPAVEAFVVATVAPAAIFAAMTSWIMVIPALYVTAAHTLVLGIPLFLLMRRKGWFNLASALTGGMVIGLVPIAIATWPLWLTSSPSNFEWLSYIKSACLFGAFGGFGALAFCAYLSMRERGRPGCGGQPTSSRQMGQAR
jgi:hypothetical protein